MENSKETWNWLERNFLDNPKSKQNDTRLRYRLTGINLEDKNKVKLKSSENVPRGNL